MGALGYLSETSSKDIVMDLYAYTTTDADPVKELAYLTRWRNMIGAQEAGWLLFCDWTQGAANAVGNVGYGLGRAKAHGVKRIIYSIPLAFSNLTLAQIAVGDADPYFDSIHAAIAATYPGADVRGGWEEDGEWYPWSATVGKPTDFIAAFTRWAASARRHGLRPWLCPAIGRPFTAGDPGPAIAPDLGPDVYRVEGVSDAGMFVNWWMENTLNAYASRVKAVMEWGSTGDDAAYVAEALAQFQKLGLEKLVVWDSNSSYKGCISDGSQPATAIELWKVFGPGQLPTLLKGASLYRGPLTATVAGCHTVLAQLTEGGVMLLFWGDTTETVNTRIILSSPRSATGIHADGSTKPFGRAAEFPYTYKGGLSVVELSAS